MRTTAVIAAWNEEKTIADVLRALTGSPLIDEIIVVSDGSTDRTVEICRGFEGVRTVSLHSNHGKGFAMAVGVANATNDVLFFCDGDMYNITQEHITALITPVLRGECDMNIGIRNRGAVRNFMHLKMKCGPVLSGIRVMKRSVFETVPPQYQARYKVEAALNCFCSKARFRQQQTIIHGLDHVKKEWKMGFLPGVQARVVMYREIGLLLFDLYVFETWRWAPRTELPVADYDVFE